MYNFFLNALPLPSLGILKKLTSGEVDLLKVAKLLLEKQTVPGDSVSIIDEVYWQTSVQYHSGDFVGQDEEGNLLKGIVGFHDCLLGKVYFNNDTLPSWNKNTGK